MAPQPGTTHCLEIRGDVVVKRFRSRARGEPWREWRALCMLASYAPDLAPAPEHAALDAEPPVVVMSRLPGDAMGTQPLTASQVAAVAASIRRLHHAAPPEVLEATEPMPFGPVTAVARVRAMAAALGVPEDPAARHALSCASNVAGPGPGTGDLHRARVGSRPRPGPRRTGARPFPNRRRRTGAYPRVPAPARHVLAADAASRRSLVPAQSARDAPGPGASPA
jgi:hypothetical protein